MNIPNTLEDVVQERVAEVAYDISEARGFVSGQEQQDWQNAQQQVAGEIHDDLAAIRMGACQCSTRLEQTLHQRIADLAYKNAEARGFAPGHELDDWRAAEEQVAIEVQMILPELRVEQAAQAGGAMPMQHNAVEQGWENPAEIEMPAMNPG